MSRIGNKPVEIPAKVKVNIGTDGAVSVEGPKGKLSWNLPRSIKGSVAENRVIEIYPSGSCSAQVKVPIRHPLTSYFTATVRGGSPPSDTLELLGHRQAMASMVSYARVRLG